MPAIQAMRSDALALRAKEDVQEKIPSFFNSVNQALGQSVVSGQDAAEQLMEQRFGAANQVAAQLRQKVDGQGALAELTAGAGLKLISSALNTILMVLSKTTTTDLVEIASDIANFMIERKTLQLQWDAAAATYAQWTVQAGYTGTGDFFGTTTPPAGGPGALVEYSFTQWLVAPAGGAPAPGSGAYPPQPQNTTAVIGGIRQAGPSGLPFIDGRNFTTVPYTDEVTQAVPSGIVPYQYHATNWQGDPVYEMIDSDNNASTPAVPDMTRPKLVNVGIALNTPGSDTSRYGDDGATTDDIDDDQGSVLYYHGGNFYIKHTVVIQVPNDATSYTIPHSNVAITSSGIDYQLHSKGATDAYPGNPDFASSGNAQYDYDITQLDTRNIDRPNNPPGNRDFKDYDFNADGNVNGTDAMADVNGDGVINANDLLPPGYIPPRFVRANVTASPGHVVNRVPVVRDLYNNAMGGRGALRYRDALTPRWTERTGYSGSDLRMNGAATTGSGAYTTFYAWGSVGSITRVGQ